MKTKSQNRGIEDKRNTKILWTKLITKTKSKTAAHRESESKLLQELLKTKMITKTKCTTAAKNVCKYTKFQLTEKT